MDAVPNRYIVMFDDVELKKMPDLPEQAVKVLSDELVLRHGGKVTKRWHHAIRGFAAEMTEQQAMALLNDHRVKIVEEDAEMFLSEVTSEWNLDRIDSANPVRDGQYAYGDSCSTGAGVRVYVFDTGIRASHQQFRNADGSSRVIATGQDFAPYDAGLNNQDINPCNGNDAIFPNGSHGTSVASLIGGNTLGVARGATLIPVRIFNCNGRSYLSNAIAGINWAKAHYLSGTSQAAVANFSVFYRLSSAVYDPNTGTTPASPAGVDTSCWNADPSNVYSPASTDLGTFENAVADLVGTGVAVIASANNQRIDARWTSPARIPDVITVGGTMEVQESGVTRDAIWVSNTSQANCSTNTDPGSNWGPAIDVWAPAHQVNSAWFSSDTALRPSTAGLSGTSFAAPIVTGIAARYLTGGTRSIAWPLWIANYFRDRGDEARALYGDAVRTRGDLKGATDNAAWFKNICRTESPWY